MTRNSYKILAGIFFLLFHHPLNMSAQCFNAPYGQKPGNIQSIANCNGTYQTFSTSCFNGEYTKVNVTNGYQYSFQSSIAHDFITISDSSGAFSYATGTHTVHWKANFTGMVRFYTHKNAACDTDNHKKKRLGSCTIPPCSVPGAVTTLDVTDTSATISWNGATPEPVNGYGYEIRTSGSGGSGSTGLVISGVNASGVNKAHLKGLTPGTLYFDYVRSNCSVSYSSYVSGSFTTSGTAPNPVPAFSHIVVVIGENTSAGSVYGSNSAPYINSLAALGAKFTSSFALSHPSQPNYLQLYSGSNQGITNDNNITVKFTTGNMGRELINAGKTFTTYSEGLPSVGYDGSSSGLYVRKHNPAANWMGSGTNQIPVTTNQPYSSFPVNFNMLPAVSLVVPNLCNDGHNVCSPLNNSVLQFDYWVQTHMDAYRHWALNNNSLLIITYDEDDYTGTNKIVTVFFGANMAPGVYTQTINHYNVLRTIEDAFRLTSHAGAAANAASIGFCWNVPPPIMHSVILPDYKQNTNPVILAGVIPDPASEEINTVPGNLDRKKDGINIRANRFIVSH